MREIKFRAWDKKRKEMWYPEDMTHGKMVDPDNCGSLIYCDIEQLALGADGTIYILDECGNFENAVAIGCLLYTSPSPRDRTRSRMPSSA